LEILNKSSIFFLFEPRPAEVIQFFREKVMLSSYDAVLERCRFRIPTFIALSLKGFANLNKGKSSGSHRSKDKKKKTLSLRAFVAKKNTGHKDAKTQRRNPLGLRAFVAKLKSGHKDASATKPELRDSLQTFIYFCKK